MSGLGGGNGASASCTKCVKVLRELISGLQDDNNQNHSEQQQHQQRRRKNGTTGGSVTGPPLLSALFSSTSSSNTTNDEEPPPLTLLKAIAEPPTMTQKQDGRSGSSQSPPPPKLEVEEVEDGVRLTIPVEATLPHLLRRWTKIVPLLNQSSDKQTTTGTGNEEDEDDILKSPHYLASNALATSAKPASDPSSSSSTTTTSIPDPLTIELKCRKCASTGPEGGARAFLMGPQPLSVVLCHNRIDSEPEEINEILTHELTHLYDVQTLQLDLQECENLAYSEVRAAKSAECRNWSSHWQPYCAKQKAMNATHNLYPKEARSCVNKVFETAFNDNRPFHQQRGGEQSSSSKKQFNYSSSDK